MRTFTVSLLILYFFVLILYATEKPIAGKNFTLRYDPSISGIFAEADQLWVVYAFDFWGTTTYQKMPGEPGESDLFRNVLEPDPGRALRVPMSRDEHFWVAEIPIPAEVSLLSYYITDGTRNDFNDQKTYVTYIYDEQGHPVRGARFRNVDFLFMSGADLSTAIEEIEKEINDYPDHFTAHVVYWRFRFFKTVSPDTLSMLAGDCERHFADLRSQYGDTVLNFMVISLADINRIFFLSLYKREDEPVVANLIQDVNTKILQAAEAIPEALRSNRLAYILDQAGYMLLSPEEKKKVQEEQSREIFQTLEQFIGEPAPDFTFTTLSGETHRLSDFRGRYVLLDFWGSWCGPCVGEIPNLIEMHKKYAGRGLVMISISNDAAAKNWTPSQLADYISQKGMEWMQVLDDMENTINRLYNIRFYPNVFLIDPQGHVVQRRDLMGERLKESLARIFPE